MSSLRNSVQRRNHKERGQLAHRERLGLLEKHKDYSLRAKDYKKKKTILKSLKAKAAEKNEDEFYFGMMSRKLESGAKGGKFTGTVLGDRGNKSLDVDTVRILKTQDIGYLRTMRNVALKEVKELEQQAILAEALKGNAKNRAAADEDDEDEDDDFASAPRKPTKILFVDDSAVVDDAMDQQDDDQDMEDAESEFEGLDDEPSEADAEAEAQRKKSERLRKRLLLARKRLKALTDAEIALDAQRARMSKTPTAGGGGVNKAGKKIKIRERKR